LGSTAPIQRNGVRHLDANDPLRRAALATPSKGKGGMKYLSITCSECRFEKGRKHYSKSQLKKNAAARCNQCCAGEPSQRDAEVEAEKAAYPTVMRGLEGRLCWGCASIATGHEVYCQTCKKIPTWFCTPECRAKHQKLHLFWHLRRSRDPTFEIRIGQTYPDEEIDAALESWSRELRSTRPEA